MGDNSQKTPLARTLNRFAEQKVLDRVQQLGKSLPCHVVSVRGAIVTVAFDVTGPFTLPNVTVPLFGPEYVRYPIKAGDRGVVLAADAYLGGVSGLGGGTADLTQRANLATLVFLPIANASWFTVDPNAVTVYGPDGVVLQTQDGSVKLIVNAAGVSVVIGGTTYSAWTTAGLAVTGHVTATQNVVAGQGGADQVGLQTHTHAQPNDSAGDVEQPTSAPTPGT